jgi:hypothetical protein
MQVLLFVAVALLSSLQSEAFKLPAIPRQTVAPINMALQLETIRMPVQLNPRDYFYLLQKLMPEEDIIRWYIAKIEDDTATIEVVKDNK